MFRIITDMFLLTMLLLLLVLPTSMVGWSKVAGPTPDVLPAQSVRPQVEKLDPAIESDVYRSFEKIETEEESKETTPSKDTAEDVNLQAE